MFSDLEAEGASGQDGLGLDLSPLQASQKPNFPPRADVKAAKGCDSEQTQQGTLVPLGTLLRKAFLLRTDQGRACRSGSLGYWSLAQSPFPFGGHLGPHPPVFLSFALYTTP